MDKRADKVSIAVTCQGKTFSIGTSMEPDKRGFIEQWIDIGAEVILAWKKVKTEVKKRDLDTSAPSV
jgi:hypothetical protein